MLRPPLFKSVLFLSGIWMVSLCLSCEEAYQEAKDHSINKEHSTVAEDTLSPVTNGLEDDIPVFKNEAMNRVIEQYTAVSVRLEIAAGQGASSEVEELQKKKQDIFSRIEDLRPLLMNEEQVALDQYLQSLGEEVRLHQH